MRQLIAIIVSCSALAGCTPIRPAERFDLVGYWQTDGYVCRGTSGPLHVRIAHDGFTLTAYRRLDDACGMYGDVSWMGQFPSGQVNRSALPISFNVLVNTQKAEERARLTAVASVTSPDAITIRFSDGTHYSLVREREPQDSEDLPQESSATNVTDERETMANPATAGSAGSGAGAPAGGRTADDHPAGMGGNVSTTGGHGGMPAADGGRPDSGAADSGAAGGAAPASMPDAGMTSLPKPDAGTSNVPMDAGAPTSGGSRPNDSWSCSDSTDTDGLPRCVCDADTRHPSDTCKLPKPTCCFVFHDSLGDQCTCYQPDSKNCKNFTDQIGIFGGSSVPSCPP